MLSAETTARTLCGRLAMRFERDAQRTRLAAIEQTPPFHVQRPLYLDAARPGMATVQVLSSVAGLFAGDRLEQEIAVGPGAAVSLSTPAMARAFAMPECHAELTTSVRVSAAGFAELLPAPLLLCAGASVVQRLEANVEPGGRLVWGEVIAFGRTASGEAHAYCLLEQQILLSYAGEPVLVERLRATGPEASALGLFGSWNAYGALNLLTDAATAETCLSQVRAELAARDVWGGASLLGSGVGVGVRLLACHAYAAQLALRRITERLAGL